MPMNMQYNGWSNRETWLMNMWLNNEASTYHFVLAICNSCDSSYRKANRLEEEIFQSLQVHEPLACVWKDLLRCSLNKVNWREIVDSFNT